MFRDGDGGVSTLPSAPGHDSPSTERSHAVETMLPAGAGAEDAEDVCPGRIFSKSIKLMLERQKFPPYQQEMLLLRKKIKLYQQDMLLGRQKSTLYQHAAGEAIHSTSMLLERQKPTLYQQDMLEERAKITFY